jgi:hypothetical protein
MKRELQFLSEDIDSEKVADFNVGEHCSHPCLRVCLQREFRAAIRVKRRVVAVLEPGRL